MPVRPARPEDADAVLVMMAELWPDEDAAGFLFEAERVFIWERKSEARPGLGGFAEVSVRPYVDGAESAPCPHVEAWWVAPDLRRRGVGRALIAAVEDWARAAGFAELSSDALLSNRRSRAAHTRLGFEATERIQYFRKRL